MQKTLRSAIFGGMSVDDPSVVSSLHASFGSRSFDFTETSTESKWLGTKYNLYTILRSIHVKKLNEKMFHRTAKSNHPLIEFPSKLRAIPVLRQIINDVRVGTEGP